MLKYSEISADLSSRHLGFGKITSCVEVPKNDDVFTTPTRREANEKLTNSGKRLSSNCRVRKLSNPLGMVTSLTNGPGPPVSNYGPLEKDEVLCNGRNQSQTITNASSVPVKHYNCAIFDILKVAPDDFATQLTILDFPVFASIQPDELTSCSWSKRNKLTVAPNVVAFSKRFNHTGFWVVQEILTDNSTAKHRSELVSHFIRIAKRLYDLNNLHSLFAIVSALQSAAIYRLSKTWSYLSKKDRQTLDRLTDVFSDTDNWLLLRRHMDSLKLPCIPYLGIYLTDLVYIDMAHPHGGGLESQQRSLKMNNILRVIANYQQSDYSHLQLIPHVQTYLNSIRYIEELQKFIEDDQYKLSLKLEPLQLDSQECQLLPPGAAAAVSSSSCSSKESVSAVDSIAIASLSLSPAKSSCGSLRLHIATSASKFIPSHRKCRSLGANIFNKTHNQIGTFDRKITNPPKQIHLLDDSVLEDAIKMQPTNPSLLSPTNSGNSLPHLRASQNTAENCTLLTRVNEDCLVTDTQTCSMQGCIRRKTLLKAGRRPTVSVWQRYWLQLWASSLVYFSPKTFKGHQRSDFKREPTKFASLIGCQIVVHRDSQTNPNRNSFQLIDNLRQTIYKFRVPDECTAQRWCECLQEAASHNFGNYDQISLVSNLMSFE